MTTAKDGPPLHLIFHEVLKVQKQMHWRNSAAMCFTGNPDTVTKKTNKKKLVVSTFR